MVKTDNLQHALEVSKYIYTWKKDRTYIRQLKGSFIVLFVILKCLLNCFYLKRQLNIYTLPCKSHTASARIQAVFEDVSRLHHLFHFENKNQYTYKVTHKLELAHTMFVQCCLSEGTLCIFSSPLCLNCSHSKRLIRGH